MNFGFKMDEFNVFFFYVIYFYIYDNNGFRDEYRLFGEGMIGFFYVSRVVEFIKVERVVLEIRRYSGKGLIILNVSFFCNMLDENFFKIEKVEGGSEV